MGMFYCFISGFNLKVSKQGYLMEFNKVWKMVMQQDTDKDARLEKR